PADFVARCGLGGQRVLVLEGGQANTIAVLGTDTRWIWNAGSLEAAAQRWALDHGVTATPGSCLLAGSVQAVGPAAVGGIDHPALLRGEGLAEQQVFGLLFDKFAPFQGEQIGRAPCRARG